MRIGVCTGPNGAADAKAAGFEFIEVGAQSVLKGELDDAQWEATAVDPADVVLPMEAANGLVPASMPITGPARDLAALTSYIARVTQRAGRLGIQRLVLGSGKARAVPDGYDRGKAFDELVQFAQLASDHAHRHGVTIVIEPLRKAETNLINNVADEARLIDAVDHPGCAALVDSYHFALEDDSFDDLLTLGQRLKHVHVAEKIGRLQPGAHGQSEDAYDFITFFTYLRKMGYNERISIEGKWTGSLAEEGDKARRCLRDCWLAAGAGQTTY